eukprot:gene6831-9353_t
MAYFRKTHLFTASVISLGTGSIYMISYCSLNSSTAMRESPLNAATHLSDSMPKYEMSNKSTIITLDHQKTLREKGIIIIDNFLTSSELLLAINDVNYMIQSDETHRKSSSLQSFQINNNENLDVRQDKVVWISEISGHGQKQVIRPGLLHVLRCIRALPLQLCSNHNNDKKDNSYDEMMMGVPFSNQLACYGMNINNYGDHYIPHKDGLEHNNNDNNTASQHPLLKYFFSYLYDRELTIILYLNDENWNCEVGHDKNGQKVTNNGILRCYLGTKNNDIIGNTATEVIDIIPKGGRLVIFDSKKILHEVCPTYSRRIALTSWCGGQHSQFEWMRILCINMKEIDWNYWYHKIILRKK